MSVVAHLDRAHKRRQLIGTPWQGLYEPAVARKHSKLVNINPPGSVVPADNSSRYAQRQSFTAGALARLRGKPSTAIKPIFALPAGENFTTQVHAPHHPTRRLRQWLCACALRVRPVEAGAWARGRAIAAAAGGAELPPPFPCRPPDGKLRPLLWTRDRRCPSS